MILWHLISLIFFIWMWVEVSFFGALLSTTILWVVGYLFFDMIGLFIDALRGKPTGDVDLPWRRKD